MKLDRFLEIIDQDWHQAKPHEECHIFKGLELMRKYLPNAGIELARHDFIQSVHISKIIDAGITEDDVTNLWLLGWHVSANDWDDDDDRYLAHTV